MTESTDISERNRLFSAMNTGTPIRSYKKATLGKVAVKYWDSFNEEPVEGLLVGDPNKDEDTTIVDIWSEKEDVFFKKINASLFTSGILKLYIRPSTVEVIEQLKKFDASNEEDVLGLLGSKFFSFQSKINSVGSVPALSKLLDKAKEIGKSDKIIKLIEARIAEVQSSDYSVEK